MPQGRNEPAELPGIARVLADLRGIEEGGVARMTTANAVAALPKIASLMDLSEPSPTRA
jgi:TatD DNase family protein